MTGSLTAPIPRTATVLDPMPNGNGNGNGVVASGMRSIQEVINGHSLTADALPTFRLGACLVPKGQIYDTVHRRFGDVSEDIDGVL